MKSSFVGPIILIFIGLYFCLDNFFGIDFFSYINISFGNIWPIAILVYGVWRFMEVYNNKK